MIRSLYAKVLIGYGALAALSVVALVGTAAVLVGRKDGPDDFVRRTVAAHAATAVDHYETGGPARLAEFLRRLDRTYGGRHYLVDPAGVDVADGADRSAMLRRARPAGAPPRAEMAVAHASADGRYHLLVAANFPALFEVLPYFGWIPVAVALACLLLAYGLVRPLRRLAGAVARFGRGDLAARSDVRRGDEIGALAAEFDRMAARIETLVVAERRLLQDVSHELRSPLARLAFAVELAESGSDRPAALARCRKEVRRLTDLVGELVELTRSEGDPGAGVVGPVALDELVREVAEDGSVEAAAKGCRVESVAPETVVVAGREVLLRRAVENVVRNAVRHAPPGSAVVVSLAGDGDAARVRVRDYGPGVPPHLLESIFAPFFRVDEDRGREGGGVGLGLAIARRAVAVHGGRVAARNAAPGLEVEIELPAGGER